MESNQHKILQTIDQSPNKPTAQGIAEKLDMDLDEVRFHLDELDQGDFIKLERLKTLDGINPWIVKEVTPRGKMLLQGKIAFEDRPNIKPASLYNSVLNVTNHAPVAMQQFGEHSKANVTQNIDSKTSDILQMLHDLRQEISKLSSENQTVASDALEDIEQEVRTPEKASRIRGGLLSLWSVTKDIAAFANAVTALAQRFGLDHLLT